MFQYYPIAASSSATTTVCKAQTNTTVFVKAFSISSAASGTIQLQDTTGVVLTGVMPVGGTNGGSLVWPIDPTQAANSGWVQCTPGAGLQVVQAGGSSAGVICFVQQAG